MFEIEYRSIFDKDKFNQLKSFLDENAENLGDDNKDCYYYIFADKLLKLVNNTSKNTAKISLKLNRIGEGSAFPETEVYFSPEEFDKAKRIFDNLASEAKIMHGPQERVNYKYDGCEIALKYSDAWGYHIEIEQLIEDKAKQKEAEENIKSVANKLGVKLMSEEELKKFTQESEKDQ
jgi:adenylate cyclase class IV